MIPHLYNGHNKSFFFGAYEGWRHPGADDPAGSCPQHADEAGRFLEYDDRSTLQRAERSRSRAQPYGTDDSHRDISQIALNTLKQFYPDPNIGDPTAYTDNGVANYQAERG